MKKRQTIYEYFANYPKNQVKEALAKLTEEERAIITKRYGEDLEHPVFTILKGTDRNRFNYLLTKKLKKILESFNYNGRTPKTIYEYFSEYPKEQVNEVLAKLNDEERAIITKRYGEDLEHPVFTILKGTDRNRFNNLLSRKLNKILKSLNSNYKNNPPQTIYEHFSEYPKEQVNEALTKLTEEERSLITKRYGEDLEYPVFTVLKGTDRNALTYLLYTRLKKILEDSNYKRRNLTIYEYLSDYSKDQIDEVLVSLNDEEKKLITLRYGKDLDHPNKTKWSKANRNRFYNYLIPKIKKLLKMQKNENQKIPQILSKEDPPVIESDKTDNKLTKEDCLKILELLRTPTFTQMMNILSVKEAVIISLKLGYIDGKYFTNEVIAQFLDISEEEISETIKKILLVYKENINNFLNNVIEIATNPVAQKRTLSITSENN